MATSAELLIDGFGRIRESVADVLDGLTAEQLVYRIDADANPVSWLVWHLTRVQDDHVAAAFGVTQVWSSEGWASRLGLPDRMMDHGYGHTGRAGRLRRGRHRGVRAARRVPRGDVRADGEACVRDHATPTSTGSSTQRWTPPVTLAVRLVSVLDDDMQHVGTGRLRAGNPAAEGLDR